VRCEGGKREKTKREKEKRREKEERERERERCSIEILTRWKRFNLFGILYDLIPLKIATYTIQGRELGFLSGKKEAMMLKADDVIRLWVPSIHKLRCTRCCKKANSIGSVFFGWVGIKITVQRNEQRGKGKEI